MKLFKKVFATVIFLLIGVSGSYGQLVFKGTYRPRTELRDGYRVLRTEQSKPAFFTSQRSRLGLDYQSDRYRFHIAVQDVRTWGDVEQLQDNANLNVHEAWAALDLGAPLRLKIGRQELVYDDQRLLGSVNWTQQARSHDAAVLKFNFSGTELHLGGAYNQENQKVLGNRYTLDNYKMLTYAWFHHNMGKLGVSVLGLTDGFQKADGTNFRYTYGTYLKYVGEHWSATGTIYAQNGDDALRRDIFAYMLAGSAGYHTGGLSVTAGYDYLSGGKASDANPSRKAFSTLYATNHKFYGNMDYFLGVPGDTRYGGLQDLYLKGSFSLSSEVDLGLAYHHFALAGRVSNPLGLSAKLDKDLGSEIDSHLTYVVNEEMTVKAGYSLLSPTMSLANLQGQTDELTQHWGWIMLQLNPSFKF